MDRTDVEHPVRIVPLVGTRKAACFSGPRAFRLKFMNNPGWIVEALVGQNPALLGTNTRVLITLNVRALALGIQGDVP